VAALSIAGSPYALLRHLTLPVVAITTSAGGRTNGMIANSAQRASLVPVVPRISVYISKTNFSHDLPGHRALSAGPVAQRWFYRAVLDVSRAHADPRLDPLRERMEQELERFETTIARPMSDTSSNAEAGP
jgi:hypothetical protein